MLKAQIGVSALLLCLSGCGGRHYEVCIASDNGVGCMTHPLTKDDAVHVGSALSALGYDVVIQPKGKAVHKSAPTVTNGQTESAPVVEESKGATKI